jgi:hypothetical protein
MSRISLSAFLVSVCLLVMIGSNPHRFAAGLGSDLTHEFEALALLAGSLVALVASVLASWFRSISHKIELDARELDNAEDRMVLGLESVSPETHAEAIGDLPKARDERATVAIQRMREVLVPQLVVAFLLIIACTAILV